MKNMKLISFVGVDVQTNFEDLLSFIGKDFVCEFGILYSESQKNKRYPSFDFCEKFLIWAKDNKVNSSLHLCGSIAIDKFLAVDEHVLKLCKLADRTQLNIKIQSYTNHEELADKIINIAEDHNLTIILQKNATKKKFNEVISDRSCKKINFLHDSSGGFGREITSVSSPEEEYFTGYAGGINPGNVAKIVELIETTNSKQLPYYIDMESGIREDNYLSIKKCQEIIDALK